MAVCVRPQFQLWPALAFRFGAVYKRQVLHMIGLILSISKNKIFEVGDVDQKIEQANIIMNENVFKDVDPEELAMKLNISYSWFRKVFKAYTCLLYTSRCV